MCRFWIEIPLRMESVDSVYHGEYITRDFDVNAICMDGAVRAGDASFGFRRKNRDSSARRNAHGLFSPDVAKNRRRWTGGFASVMMNVIARGREKIMRKRRFTKEKNLKS